MKKKIPTFKTDEEAERFVERADLTDYDLSGLRGVQFEFKAKDDRSPISTRRPSAKL